MSDFGHLSLAVGGSVTKLEVEKREFEAVGTYCIMKTEGIPTFGSTVRFEGNIEATMKRHFGMGSK